MKASIVDLKYKMSEVLSALDRRERVDILYHGKVKGIILPVEKKSKVKVSKHPFFGMTSGKKKTVEKVMEKLRGS